MWSRYHILAQLRLKHVKIVLLAYENLVLALDAKIPKYRVNPSFH
jgi:hypothetical protein